MSFFTSLFFYRPTPPPKVTGPDLATFVRAFAALGVADDNGHLSCSVKFGKSIDQDEKPTFLMKRLSSGISTFQEIKWDLEEDRLSVASIAALLESKSKSVYRANLSLGDIAKDVGQHVSHEPHEGNKLGLYPDTWELEIGTVTSSDLESEQSFHVGWLSIGLSGNGYLYPWTFSELVRRAEASPGIQKVMALCRATWPVPHYPLTKRQLQVRQLTGTLWPYENLEKPWDWYWGVHESG